MMGIVRYLPKLKSAIIHPFFIVALGVMAGKATGFVRELSLASAFGASAELDRYLVAMSVPTLLLYFSGALFPALLTPRMNAYAERGDRAALRQINVILTFIGLFYVSLAMLLEIFAPQVVRLLAPSYRGEAAGEAVTLIRWLLPYACAAAAIQAGIAMLQARRMLAIASMSQVPANVAMIACILIGAGHSGIMIMPIAWYMASVLQLLWIGRSLARLRIPFRLERPGSREQWQPMAAIGLQAVSSTLLVQLGVAVERMWSSSLEPGSVSYLSFGYKALEFPFSLLYAAVSAVMFPALSRIWEALEDRSVRFSAYVRSSLFALVWLAMPLTIIMAIRPTWIVSVLYLRGRFTPEDAWHTANVLRVYSLALLPMIVRDFVNFAFVASGRFKITLHGTIVQTATYVAALVLLVPRAGYVGVPYAFMCAAIIQLVYLWYRRNGGMSGPPYSESSYASIVRIGIGATIAWLTASLLFPLMDEWPAIAAIGTGTTAVIGAYAAAAKLLRIPILRWLKADQS